MSSEHDQWEAFVARLSAGGAVPEVDPADLAAAVAFFAELRARQAALGLGARTETKYSFLLEDLAVRCSPGADLFGVGMRGMELDAVLIRASTSPQSLDADGVARYVAAMARLPLMAEDLGDPETLRGRILEAIEER